MRNKTHSVYSFHSHYKDDFRICQHNERPSVHEVQQVHHHQQYNVYVR